MSKITNKLLIEMDLPSLMRSRNANLPPVPSNWKPGIFADDKPWGTLEDAMALLRYRKINEGRELLRRLCKHSSDSAAQAAFSWELMRPPENDPLSLGHLSKLSPSSCEFRSLKAVRALMNGEYREGGESYMDATEVRPASPYGCTLLMTAFLFFSDVYFQTRLLMPRKRPMETRIVTSPLKGAAGLMVRMHEGAWDTFKKGWVFAEEKAASYPETLKVKATEEERAFIQETLETMCPMGMALILWDLGLRRESAEVFAELSKVLEGNLQYAAHTLSRT